MKRFEINSSAANLMGNARKLGMAAAAAALLVPVQAAAQIGPGPYTCDSGITLDAQGQQPFFVNEPIPIVITLEAEAVSDGTSNGVLHIEEFDFKPDCQEGTDFNTCVGAGNTVVIATPDNQIGGSCGVSFSTSDVDADTIRFTPDNDIVLAPTETCTVEFDVVVEIAPSGTPAITEAGGWVESQIACYNTDVPPVEYPELARSSASGQLRFQLSTQRTEFRVTKIFADQSDTETADVKIQCNGGFPLSQEFTLDHTGQVWFVVKEFIPGRLTCTVWEEPVPAGYSVVYSAGDQGGTAGSITDDANGCTFTNVETGVFTCDVINNIDQVEVTVNKEWTLGLDTLDLPFELEADARYACYNVYTSPDGAGGTTTVEGSMTFSGEFSSQVITGVYPASRDSYCTVIEVNVPEEWVEADDSDCERVPVISGAECTILNTAFFEGIPTLSQYGMAIMALLMLGIGLVGFRRFA
jgi:hypothetical protein